VAPACKPARNAGGIAAGWHSTFDQDRGACRVDPGGLQGDARHHLGRVAGASGRSRPPRSHSARYGGSSRGAGSRAKKTTHATEQDRPDILKRREEWLDGQLDLDPEQLIFIDETWASTNMARRYGRAPRGERLRAGVPHGHWKTTTFVAGLSRTGMIAPWVLDGAMNGEAFTT